MTLTSCVLLATALFCVGVYGLLTRRDAVGILLSIEVMANAANLNLVAFAHYSGGSWGHAFVLFILGLTVAEVAIGLALVLLLHRSQKDVLVDLASTLRN
jgi:NADH-quinone oxidoreductase subunit K